MWVGNQFFYSKRLLKTIAESYANLYDGLPTLRGQIINPWVIAEYKADFDIALSKLGRGHWDDNLKAFKYYRHFGRLQQIVIADILGIDDYELAHLGFYDITRLRGFAYYSMRTILNGGK